jgi:spermidine synthase
MVEIDTQDIDVAKQYFSIAAAFKDARLTLIHDTDGFEYMETTCETFDVIIADALDPIHPTL